MSLPHFSLIGSPVWPVLALLALASSAATADEHGTRDCLLTVRARQALAREAALAPLNLGVTVREGVATLYGSVPSPALARLARETVAAVQGVLEVRGELEIRPPDDPLSEFLNLLPKAVVPLPDLLAHERYPAPGWLTSHWGDSAASSRPAVSLMAPVTPRAPAAPAAVVEKTDLAGAVERLRRADIRFHRLRAEVRDGMVRLGGIAERREDAMAFAQQVSRLPGVGRVIIQEVRTPNDP